MAEDACAIPGHLCGICQWSYLAVNATTVALPQTGSVRLALVLGSVFTPVPFAAIVRMMLVVDVRLVTHARRRPPGEYAG